MLRKANELLGFHLKATDGEIGRVKDLLFDDQSWGVQYFVADTGGWLPGRRILISPQSVEEPDWDEELLEVSLSRQQIEDSPPITEDQPVSRQAQSRLGAYFNWGAYWMGYFGPGIPRVPPGVHAQAAEEAEADTEADPHLRSMKEVLGYGIEAQDGAIGHVEDFIVQTDVWSVQYLIVDTRNWLPGRKVLVSPAWITELDWLRVHVKVDLPRESIRNAPQFDPDIPLAREYESRLYAHYGLPPYWNTEGAAGNRSDAATQADDDEAQR